MAETKHVPGRRTMGRALVPVLGALVCAGMFASLVTPARASDGTDHRPSSSVLVGSFALADAIEGTLVERDGSFAFPVTAAGLEIGWDSQAAGNDDDGLGYGWRWKLPRISTLGGIEVQPRSGGSFPLDPTHPSGLAGYGAEDVVFVPEAGVLPAHAGDDEVAGRPAEELGYRFALHELGQGVTYFDEAGDPVAMETPTASRTQWIWDDVVPHRLVGVVDVDGVVTSLDWESRPGSVLIERGVNLPAEDAERPVWRFELAGGRLSAVHSPAGDSVLVGYADDSGLVEEIVGAEGGVTRIAWRDFGDRVPRAERVRTEGAGGVELSARSWSPAGGTATSSGWPDFNGEGDVFWSGDPAFRYRTALSDGATRVVSEYNSGHTLVSRDIIVAGASGETTVQAQSFTRPGTEEGGVPDPAALPADWAMPVRTETTFRDERGGERAEVELVEYDALGRATRTVAADGKVTETWYDPEIAEGALLPVGHALSERVFAPDGLVSETGYELDGSRSVPTRTERREGRVGTDGEVGELAVAGRTDRVVEADGFVSEERALPISAGDEPKVTRRSREVDLAAGTVVTSETTAAGSSVEATTREVRSLRHGEVIARVDAVGNTETSAYDADGRVTSVIDAAGNETVTVYETARNDGRNATTTLTAAGVARTELTDAIGRVVENTDNIRDGVATEGHVRVEERREYPEAGTVAVTDAWGATTVTRQDVYGRTVAVTGPSGRTDLTRYDDVANTTTTATSATAELGEAELVEIEERDPAGNVVRRSSTRADGARAVEERSSFDGLGREILTDNGALETLTSYDGVGNPLTTTLNPNASSSAGAPVTAARRFDGFGEVLEKVLSDGNATRSGGERTFDAQGRAATDIDQLGRVSIYTYTADGLLERAEDGSGQVVEHTYDPKTRAVISTVTTAPGAEAVRTEHEYDPVTGKEIRVWDPADREGSEQRFDHDAFGNVTRLSYPDGREIEYRYDEHGRRTGTVDVDGNVTKHEYDVDGALERATQRDRKGGLLAEVTYERDDQGRVETMTRDNDVVTAYTYTSASEVAVEHTTRGEVTLSKREYTYDERGNLLSRVDAVHDEVGSSGSTSTAYAYDAYDRLTRSVEHDGGLDGRVTKETAYDLSVSGDLLAERVVTDPETAEQSTVARAFEYTPLGELTGITTTTADGSGEHVERHAQVYDGAGNLIESATGTTYTWDARARPIAEALEDGTVIRTSYWADGSRRERASDDGATVFYWDDAALVNEVHRGAGGGVAAYLIGEKRHARTTIAADGAVVTSHYGIDRHGNITDLMSAEGAVTERYAYSDYGVQTRVLAGVREPVTGIPTRVGDLHRNPFGYSGEYTDESGTQHLQTREYDTVTARFVSMDSEDLHNLFAYADLNPIMKIDPTGREGWFDAGLEHFGIWWTMLVAVASIVSGAMTVASGGLASVGAFTVMGWVLQAAALGMAVTGAVNEYGPELFSDSVAVSLELAANAMAVSGLIFIRWSAQLAERAASAYRAIRRPFAEMDNVIAERFPGGAAALESSDSLQLTRVGRNGYGTVNHLQRAH